MISARCLASTRALHVALTIHVWVALAGLGSAQVLQIANESVTTFLPTATSTVQGVRPLQQQRAVNIDGSPRGAFGLPVAIAGNPYENAWTGHTRMGELQLDVGAYAPFEVDIALPTKGFPWIIGRGYSARQQNSSGTPIDSTGSAQGANWFQTSQPEIVLHDDSDNSKDTLVLILNAASYATFRRFDSTSSRFRGVNGTTGCFEYTNGGSGVADTWKLTDQRGTEVTFFGFDTDAAPAAGQIWKIVDPDGNTAFVGDSSSASTAISSGYDTGGRILKAFDADERRFSYVYETLNSVVRLTQVKAETKTGGTWSGTPTGVATVGQVNYSYFGDEAHGDVGDLKTVTVTRYLSESSNPQVLVSQMRYWEGAYDATSNPGYPHALKYVYSAEGLRGYDWLDATLDQDYLSASDEALLASAAAFFEYDSSHRVRKAWFDGGCGCSGAGNGAHEFTYEAVSYTSTSGYDSAPAARTVIKRPDGSFLTQYFDEAGQALSQVITDIDPASASPTPLKWVTCATRDANGCIESVCTPASVTAYTHNASGSPSGAITVSSSVGLVQLFERNPSGDLTGFMTKRKHAQGTGGTAYLDERLTFDVTTCTKTLTDATILRPLVATRRTYTSETTDVDTDALETSMSYTAWSGAALSVETVTTVAPVVSTSNNGPGGSVGDKVAKHFRKDGRVDFERRFFDPNASESTDDRTITYFGYAKGQVTRRIEDADTTSGDITVSVPTGFSSLSTATRLAKKTDTTYAASGLKDEETPAGTNQKVEKVYYSRLADQRLVVLEYNHFGGGFFYGPVRIQVLNQAGKTEMSGIIALPGGGSVPVNQSDAAQSAHIDETDADPITAIDTGSSFGTLAQMTTFIYDETGTELQEERRYFSIPSSGAGTEGTHYNATRYGYDDSGRRWRTKEASGTIRRTVFDLFGHAIDQYVGTNDHAFSGGESSGTDNMVKTEHLDFDGGSAGKNGLITKRTLYVRDGTTGQRVTEMHHDYRGRLIFEEPPLAPFSVHKFDNLGRRVATGFFSSASGLSASTDPTSTATNRLALDETVFDEQSRTWKTVRHKIDAADGSDDDSLASRTWFDRLGRVVKVNGGGQFRKTKYDRLGRVTDEFDLASDNDAAYADVLTVSGDVVPEQHETRYDPVLDTVILRVAISRLFNDYGSGQTTGALDSDADGNPLVVTAANVATGRVQISSYFFDRMKRERFRLELGTNSASGNVGDYDRSAASDPPTGSDTALVWETVYDTDGTLKLSTDPRSKVTKHVHDGLGRRTGEIRNFDAGVNSGNPSGTDDNVTVSYAYTNGLRTLLTADLPSGQTDQVTTYAFGTVKGTSAGDSLIATGHLPQKETYPDSASSTDVVTRAFNAQGEEIWKRDQAGNATETEYDLRGRVTQIRITTLASGFDGTVRRIATTYDALGRRRLVTQYDNATVGSGSVLDEVRYSYDGWGNVEKFEQDWNSAVGASGSVDHKEVSYTWVKATTGRHTIQLETVTLPSGKVLTLKYRDRNGLHDKAASRVTEIAGGSLTLVAYDYNGVGQVVRTAYPEPSVSSKQHTGSGSSTTFPDLDRFNRVVKSRWTKAVGSGIDFYHVELAYDRASNITSAKDLVHSGFDVKYVMDDVDRLVDADEGTLSGGSITSRTRREEWILSHTGNWDRYKRDLNGDGDCSDADEVDDCRTHNEVNELVHRNLDCMDDDECDVDHDEAGNMTSDGNDYRFEWDAWYRLVRVRNLAGDLIVEFRYNGLGFKIAEHADTNTDNKVDGDDKWFYDLFDERWRQVARFRESDTSPKEEFVHHQAGLDGHGGSSYIDLVACRYKDANTAWTSASDGVLEERIYYCQNQHADVAALISSAGGILEWVKYSPYGVPFGLPGGDTDSDGDCDSADVAQIQAWIDAHTHSVRGDLDLDGDVDATDKSIALSLATIVLGQGVLSSQALINRRAFAGMKLAPPIQYEQRARWLYSNCGRWISRDLAPYEDGISLYQTLQSAPVEHVDPGGRTSRWGPQGPEGPYHGPGGPAPMPPAHGEETPPMPLPHTPPWYPPMMSGCIAYPPVEDKQDVAGTDCVTAACTHRRYRIKLTQASLNSADPHPRDCSEHQDCWWLMNVAPRIQVQNADGSWGGVQPTSQDYSAQWHIQGGSPGGHATPVEYDVPHLRHGMQGSPLHLIQAACGSHTTITYTADPPHHAAPCHLQLRVYFVCGWCTQ